MADKQFNITNNSPNYTKNNNINNINYVKRNGAGWSWFKTIFIACMLTIFSVVCFAGGKDAIPQGYTNSIKTETINTLIGYDVITPDISSIMNELTPENIYNYKFRFINYDNYYPYSSPFNYFIEGDRNKITSDIYCSNTGIKYSYGNWSFSNSTAYNSLNIFPYYPPSSSTNVIKYSYSTNKLIKNTDFDYFSFKLRTTCTIPDFQNFKIWLTNNFTIDDLAPITIEKYSSYTIKYATYDWNIKLTQLSKLKNVFTPLFSANIPDEEATLQKGFDQFQEFIDLGVLTYTGDKITPNRKMSENWEYNANLLSFAKFDEMIHLLTSNLGKYINANYWYDSSTREFVRFDTNVIYGSINDTNTTLKNVVNLLSYPITTGFNITYNIGVLFTFVFVW